MQTFITHADFNIAASHLDNKRLNKQLLEGRQILDVLATRRTVGGWVNHPAVRMWHGYERVFYKYLVAIKNECVRRGIATEKNWQAIEEIMQKGSPNFSPNEINPWWLTDTNMVVRVTQSHRANLYKKDPEYYYDFAINAKMFDDMRERVVCCDKCNYCWPSHVAYQRKQKQMQDWLARPLP